MSTVKSPAELIEAAKLAAATKVLVEEVTSGSAGTPAPAAKPTKSYQFPSAPTTFEFTHSGRRIAIPDGVFVTSDEKDIAELDACVAVGIIYPYIDPTVTPFATPPAPIDVNKVN